MEREPAMSSSRGTRLCFRRRDRLAPHSPLPAQRFCVVVVVVALAGQGWTGLERLRAAIGEQWRPVFGGSAAAVLPLVP
jgi:hypothetical protein